MNDLNKLKDIIFQLVFVVRNPKDTVVSFLHHHRIWKNHGYVGTQDEFVDYFVNDMR